MSTAQGTSVTITSLIKRQGINWLLFINIVGIVAFALFSFFLWPKTSQPVIANVFFNALYLPALVLSIIAACYHQGTKRKAWIYLTLAMGLWFVADNLWSVLELGFGIDPFPSIADFFYIAGYIPLTAGIWLLHKPQYNRNEGFRISLDITIIILGISLLFWRSMSVPSIDWYMGEPLAMVVGLTYPVLDLAFVSLTVLMLFARRAQALSSVTLWLIAFLTIYILADTYFFLLEAEELYVSGHPVDILYVVATLLFGIAAYISMRNQTSRKINRLTGVWADQFVLYAPYVAVVLAFTVMFMGRNDGGISEAGLLIGLGLVTLTVIIRQIIAIAENQRLNQELKDFSLTLEQKVIERTRELKDSQAKLLASENLASIGRLTAGLAHEINTPLAAARNQILQAKNLTDEYQQSIGLADVTEDDHREIATELSASIKDADASLERLGEFVRRMRSHSRTSNTKVDFDPYKVAEDSLAMLEHRARKTNIELRLEPSQTALNLHGDPARFNQVISNLLVNAMDAFEGRSNDGALVKLHFEKQDDQIVMFVEDNGCGISADTLPKIFEPMFTTKEIGKGTGLGLSIIHNIITGSFNGAVDVSTVEGQGSIFKVVLPTTRK